jgi:hypothetical protein
MHRPGENRRTGHRERAEPSIMPPEMSVAMATAVVAPKRVFVTKIPRGNS